jgi:hypothetical protein
MFVAHPFVAQPAAEIGVKRVPWIIPAMRNFGRIPLRKRAGVEPFQIVRPEPLFGEGGHYEYVTKFKNPATVLGNPLMSNFFHEKWLYGIIA